MTDTWIPIFSFTDTLISGSNAAITLLIIWASKRQILAKAPPRCLGTSSDGPGLWRKRAWVVEWRAGVTARERTPVLPSQPILSGKGRFPKIPVGKLLVCEPLCRSMWVPEGLGPNKVVFQGNKDVCWSNTLSAMRASFQIRPTQPWLWVSMKPWRPRL